MKKIIIFSLVSFLQWPCYAQLESKEVYQERASEYRAMAKTGIIVAASGLALTIGGSAYLIQLEEKKRKNPTYPVGSKELIVGALVGMVGVPMIISGSVLAAVAGAQQTKYKKKLEGLSLHMHCGPQQQRMALVYNF